MTWTPVSDNSPTWQVVGDASGEAAQRAADRAESAATAAEASATDAATSLASIGDSEANAAASATAAADSAAAASTAESNAAAFDAAAATSASTATAKAGEAATSASKAATSETNAATSAGTATTKAGEAADSATAAGQHEADTQALYDNFRGTYYGALTADPTTDPLGAAVNDGDWYYNTTSNKPRIRSNGVWGDIGSSTATLTERTLTQGQTAITSLTYAPGFELVWLNGVKLIGGGVDYTATDGVSVTLTDPASAGFKFSLLAFGTFNVADAYTKTEADNRYQQIAELESYRNLIVNGDFESWQEGTSFALTATGSVYYADVWKGYNNLDAGTAGTLELRQYVFPHGQTDVPGATYAAECYISGRTSGANGVLEPFYQFIEDVRRLAGKTITVSFPFYASVSCDIAISMRQRKNMTDGWVNDQYVRKSLVAGWQVVTHTFEIPALAAADTVDEDSCTLFQISLEAKGTNRYPGFASDLVAQAGTYRLADVQVEKGSTHTPFERTDPGVQLLRTSRYFQRLNCTEVNQGILAANTAYGSITLPSRTPMRKRPTPTKILFMTRYVAADDNTFIDRTLISLGVSAEEGVNTGYFTWGSVMFGLSGVSMSKVGWVRATVDFDARY